MTRPNRLLAATLLVSAAVALAACGSARSPGFRPAAPLAAPTTVAATASPTLAPTAAPTAAPTPAPTLAPTLAPATPFPTPSEGGPGSRGGWDRIPEIVAEVETSVVTVLTDLGLGSGVVWDADGVIVTNNHVIAGASAIQIAFRDGERVDATVVAADGRTDLAVLRTSRTDLPAATFSDVLPLVGSLAIAIGSPLGLEETVTAGIISGLHREVPGSATQSSALVDLLQTDAAISPGNSGGALVGADGRVIGINVAYLPPAGGAVSIGFAIPAPTVIDAVNQLLTTGRVKHAFLGIQPAQLTPQVAQQFGLSRTTGVLVVDLDPDTPAARAGMEPGDVIVGMGDETIETVEDFLGALRRREPGDEVTFRVVRGTEELELQVTLGDLPD